VRVFEGALALAVHLPSKTHDSHFRKRKTMGIVIALLIGLIAGALAKLIMPGRDPGGIFVTMLLGVAGSIVAYLLGSAVGWYHGPGEGPGIIASVVGACVLLGIYRLAKR
jgi:uncharacterized membrane protein YeaQ/YmgE (transglycosylase-associated protein family)